MLRIVVTGVPGTGKTIIAKMLAKKIGYGLIDIKKIVEKNKIYEIKDKEKIVNLKKLRQAILKELGLELITKGYIIEGHLACEIALTADLVIVLRTNPNTLIKRLRRRGYDKKKIAENILAELLDYCVVNAMKNYRTTVVELDTSRRNKEKCVDIIIREMKNKKKNKKIDCINYRNELLKYLGLK